MNKNYIFTSESVSEGHPDKLCDIISDTVLDLYLSKFNESRVACETLATTNRLILSGEVRGPDIQSSEIEALETISKIIQSRQKDGQLDNSDLSLGEIFLIKRAFLSVWKRIRHRRIQYPTSKNNTFS